MRTEDEIIEELSTAFVILTQTYYAHGKALKDVTALIHELREARLSSKVHSSPISAGDDVQ